MNNKKKKIMNEHVNVLCASQSVGLLIQVIVVSNYTLVSLFIQFSIPFLPNISEFIA